MTPTLHRILYHSKDVIDSCPVPIGWTSEEGSEANNKFARDFESNHSRKTSNEDSFLDLFHRLMDISDPVLVKSSTKEKQQSDLTPDMRKLVHLPKTETWEINRKASESDTELDLSIISFEDTFNCSIAMTSTNLLNFLSFEGICIHSPN